MSEVVSIQSALDRKREVKRVADEAAQKAAAEKVFCSILIRGGRVDIDFANGPVPADIAQHALPFLDMVRRDVALAAGVPESADAPAEQRGYDRGMSHAIAILNKMAERYLDEPSEAAQAQGAVLHGIAVGLAQSRHTLRGKPATPKVG